MQLEAADPLEVHDHGAVRAEELVAADIMLELGERAADQVHRIAHVQAGVIIRCLDPVDLGDREEQHPARALDDESLHRLVSRRRIVRDLLLGPAERALEARVIEGLQQVIERPSLEGAQRVLVVRGHEDYRRQKVAAQLLEHVEAVAFGHLHIEEHEVGLRLADDRDRIKPAAAFRHRGDRRVRLQQCGQVAAGEGFIIDHQDSKLHSHPAQWQCDQDLDTTGFDVAQLQVECIRVQDHQARAQVRNPDAIARGLPVDRQLRSIVVDA